MTPDHSAPCQLRTLAGKLVIRIMTTMLCLVSVLTSVNSIAWQSLTENLHINCAQSESRLLACSYRLLIPESPSSVGASMNGQTLDMLTHNIYPTADAVTSILLLVDTSDPGRQSVITRNISQIEHIVNNAPAHQRIGLASFDTNLIVHAMPGSPSHEIIQAAQSLTAAGRTTELYFNTIRAIEVLARTNADRKVILLFSDGQAEDVAYYHQDAVDAARSQGVIINSAGFPRSNRLSVALQSLRRLSDETGGMFVGTDMDFNLPASFIAAPFANIDRGGQFVVDLDHLHMTDNNPADVQVNFITATSNISIAIPVNLPLVPPVIGTETLSPAPAVTVQPRPVIATVTGESDMLEPWLWYGVPTVLITLVILSLIALVLLMWQQQVSYPANSGQGKSAGGRVYLVTQDNSARPYPVTASTCRIGRARDNEMFINDSSVSRKHAEIRRQNNGNYVLYDRNSTNGVFVNRKKVSKHRLQEGDIIQIGDVYLRFTEYPDNFRVIDIAKKNKLSAT